MGDVGGGEGEGEGGANHKLHSQIIQQNSGSKRQKDTTKTGFSLLCSGSVTVL